MTTYTYPADGRGEPVSGLSARDVAIERLTHDGHRYEMRRETDGGWQIYASQRSENSSGGAGKMPPSWSGPSPYGKLLVAFVETEDEAWAKLAPLVVMADWHGVPDAMTDADYQAMLAELAAEDE